MTIEYFYLPKCTVGTLRNILNGMPDDAPIESLYYPPGDEATGDIKLSFLDGQLTIEGYKHNEDSVELTYDNAAVIRNS